MSYCCEVAAQGGVCTCLRDAIDSALSGTSWDSVEPEVKEAFTSSMRGFQYSDSAKQNAWGWWYDGWRRHVR